jgi:hypothetical protein
MRPEAEGGAVDIRRRKEGRTWIRTGREGVGSSSSEVTV